MLRHMNCWMASVCSAAYELLDGICLFCSTQELRYLTDAELIETIYAQ